MAMRARIEAAQRRRESRSSQRICAWTAVIVALAVTGVLLRQRPLFTSAQHSGGQVAEPADLRTSSLAAANAAVETTPEPKAEPEEQQQEKPDASAAGDGGGVDGVEADGGEEPGKVYYYTGPDDGPQERHEVVDEPIPEDCHVENGADYRGDAMTWGLTHKTASAAACCAECRERSGPPDLCNVWVWCGDPSGVCWTPDIWNHTTGSCWLKRQPGWDGNVDRGATNLEINARGDYSQAFREQHKSAPAQVPWTAGLIVPTTT